MYQHVPTTSAFHSLEPFAVLQGIRVGWWQLDGFLSHLMVDLVTEGFLAGTALPKLPQLALLLVICCGRSV